MAKTVRHIMRRGSTFVYRRRVPQAVIDRQAAFQAYFGGKPFFQLSLRTSELSEALANAAEAAKQFDAMVKAARLPPSVPTNAEARPVTREVLNSIARQQAASTEREFSQIALLRERADRREDVEIAIEILERHAEALNLECDTSQPSNMPALDFDAIAEDFVESMHLRAPTGTDAFALVRRVVRESTLEAYRNGFDVLSGKRSLLAAAQAAPRTDPKFSKIVQSYAEGLDKKRTKTEVLGALKSFLDLHGDLPLSELKREHFIELCRHEGGRDIGGRSRGSIQRPMSAETIKKKIRLLGTA